MATGKFRKVFNASTGQTSRVELSEAQVNAISSRVEEAASVLTPAQFWMQLAIDGDEAAALAIIDTLPRVQQILALRARDYRRDNALLIQLATAMQKSSDDIDAFFRSAYLL